MPVGLFSGVPRTLVLLFAWTVPGVAHTPPRAVIRTRMFYLPDSAHRKELMIIYVKALTSGDLKGRALPAESPGVDWPDLSREVVEEAQRDVRIQTPGGHD